MAKTWRLMLHTLYYTYIAPNYKTMFFAEQGNYTRLYMLESI